MCRAVLLPLPSHQSGEERGRSTQVGGQRGVGHHTRHDSTVQPASAHTPLCLHLVFLLCSHSHFYPSLHLPPLFLPSFPPPSFPPPLSPQLGGGRDGGSQKGRDGVKKREGSIAHSRIHRTASVSPLLLLLSFRCSHLPLLPFLYLPLSSLFPPHFSHVRYAQFSILAKARSSLPLLYTCLLYHPLPLLPTLMRVGVRWRWG
mmetsp:Transcript_37444/g.96723  ORF Transcript_37444/g.96723 Transcript_37444/m.96723 type:complete len:202 (-) Transcript_37444:334-939(-)